MGQMMLDAVYFSEEGITRESHLQLALDRKPFALVTDTIQNEFQIRPLSDRISQPAQEICFWIAVNGDVVDLGELGASLSEAIADCLRRKAGPVLDAPKALFFRCGNNLTIAEQTG